MINKRGLWFLTLFSLILVLSIYYITMPNEIYTLNETSDGQQEETNNTEPVNSEIESSNYITSLKVELETKREEEIKKQESIINTETSTTEEKDNAYEKIKDINNIRGLEQQAIDKIKENLSLDSYVEIDNTNISVIIEKEDHDKALANSIMKMVQELFTSSMQVSVKFI